MKKILSLILMMILAVPLIFSGCSLLQINSDTYLDRTVATVTDANNQVIVSVSKRDLLNSYQANASMYINTYGYTTKQTVSTLLDGLIDRRLLIYHSKQYFGDLETNNDYIEEYNEAVEDVFKYFDSQIMNYENQLRTIYSLDLLKDEEETKESAETDYAPYKEYEKKVLYFEDTNSYELVTKNEETGEYERTYGYKLVYNGDEQKYERYFYNEETKSFDLKASTKFADVEKLTPTSYDYIARSKSDRQDLTNRAYDLFLNNLKQNQDKKLSKEEDKVIETEFNRVLETYIGNKYIELLQEYFNIEKGIDNKAILDLYKQKVAESYAKYNELGEDGYNEYISNMNDASKDVWYNPYGDQFVKVAHVLIQFSESQLAELKQLQTEYDEKIISYEEYMDKYNAWLETAGTKARYTYADLGKTINGVAVTEEMLGNEYGEVLNYKTIYSEIEQAISNCATAKEKAEKFNEFVYKYGMDEGSFNQENYYVVNLSTDVEDKMVKEFADMSRELIKQGEGSLSAPVLVESSNYSGYHIILAIEKAKNIVSIDNLKEFGSNLYLENDIKTLYNTNIMLGTNKTLYDSLYDLTVEDEFNTYQNSILETLKNGKSINYFESYYKDLY